MGQFIIKITDPKDNTDYYMEWSTIVDAPVSEGMPLDEFKSYYERTYGTHSMILLSERLKRVNKGGSSGFKPYDNVNDFLEYNRAGKHERTLSKEDILKEYCRK